MTVLDPPARTGSPRPRRRVNRRTAWIAVATAAVIATSVAFDIGRSTTTGDRAGDLRSFAASVNTNIAACNSSVRDSYSAYAEVIAGHPGERATALGIIRGDEPNCTPVANSNLYDMATTEAPSTLRAFAAQSVVTDLDRWAYPDAAAAINDLATLLAQPSRADAVAARHDLDGRIAEMDALGRSAQGILDAAAAALRTRVPRLDVGATGSLRNGL